MPTLTLAVGPAWVRVRTPSRDRGRRLEIRELTGPKVTVVSGGHGEAAGPRHLLLRGQGDLQEAERLRLAGAAQGTGIDGAQAGGGNHIGEQRLGLGVVACDQDGSGRFAVVPAARVAAKLVLNALRIAECGSAAAICAAAELSAGTVRESKVWKSKVTRQGLLLDGRDVTAWHSPVSSARPTGARLACTDSDSPDAACRDRQGARAGRVASRGV